MRKCTAAEKSRGELAIRELSEKAQAVYNSTSPLTVWAYYTDSPEAPENERFSVKFGNELREYMDREELEEYLEDLADAFEEIDGDKMTRHGEKFDLTQDLMDTIASYMDDEIREDIHGEMCPCTPTEFLYAYLDRDPEFEKLLEEEFDIRLGDRR